MRLLMAQRWKSAGGGDELQSLVSFRRGSTLLAILILVLSASLSATAAAAEGGGGEGQSDAGPAGEPAPAEGASGDGAGEDLRPPVSRREAELFIRRADDAFLDTRYDEAARYYAALARGGFGCANVWFNLGNARWKEGRLGEAVLAWERALLRDPRHIDARANLGLARESLVDDVVGAAPPPATERLARRLPVRLVVWGFGIAWVLTAAALILRRRARSRRWALNLAAGFASILVLLLGSLSAVSVWYHEAVVRAVVTVPVAQVRSGPAPRFDSAFEIHEGLVVRVVGYEGPYARVRLANDRGGWVLRRALEAI